MAQRSDGSKGSKRSGCLWVVVAAVAVIVLGAIAGAVAMQHTPLVERLESSDGIAIEDVTVIDVVGGVALEHRDVVVRDGVIVSIAEHGEADLQGRVIDGRGMSLVPGLIDMHAHLIGSPNPPWVMGLPNIDLNLERMLFAGVTRAFDPGSPTPLIFDMRADVASGDLLGPNIHAAGPVFTALGGHPVPMLKNGLPDLIEETMIDGMVRQLGDPADVEASLAEVAAYEPDFVKMAIDRIPESAPRVNTPVVDEFVTVAKAKGLRPVAHIGDFEDAALAGDAGFSAWIHGIYKERLTEEQVAQIASYDIPMVTTMVVFKSYAELGTNERTATELEKQMADPELLASYENRPEDYVPSDELAAFVQNLRDNRQSAIDNTRDLHKAGVTILAGSDVQAGLLHGASLHRELMLLSKADISNLEVLRSATLYSAQFLAQTDDPPYGIVAPDKRADLVLVEGNPLTDITAISQVRHVILGGVLLERHPLTID